MIKALKDYDWPPQHINTLAGFWGSIMLHRYWNSPNDIAQCAIFIYQEEQCRAWHNAIPLPKGTWDLSIIDETVLLRTFDCIFWELHNRNLQDKQHGDGNLSLGHRHSHPVSRGPESLSLQKLQTPSVS